MIRGMIIWMIRGRACEAANPPSVAERRRPKEIHSQRKGQQAAQYDRAQRHMLSNAQDCHRPRLRFRHTRSTPNKLDKPQPDRKHRGRQPQTPRPYTTRHGCILSSRPHQTIPHADAIHNHATTQDHKRQDTHHLPRPLGPWPSGSLLVVVGEGGGSAFTAASAWAPS